MGRLGRNTLTYRRTADAYRTGQYPCHMCGIRPGTTVDHVPALTAFAHPSMWRGVLKPACATCQGRQGARITNERKGVARPQSRTW